MDPCCFIAVFEGVSENVTELFLFVFETTRVGEGVGTDAGVITG